MRTTRQLSRTHPKEMADVLKAKVSNGEYASESEVIRDVLRILMARDRVIESWLLEQVIPAYYDLKTDSSKPSQQIKFALGLRLNIHLLKLKPEN